MEVTGETTAERLILAHELGHVLGLDHVDDIGELMNAEYVGQSGFGPGDREGLQQLGELRPDTPASRDPREPARVDPSVTTADSKDPMKSRHTAVVALALAAALVVPTAGSRAVTPEEKAQQTRTPNANKPKVNNGCLLSVPDPGTTTPVKICYTIFRPARAKNRHKIPMLMHSHGWGGQRTTDPAKFKAFLDAGYAVISFDQRGFGESGGHAYVENPDVEGHDVRALVDRVARFPWVKKDRPGDPRLGAIGGSYGGGYQFLGAFEELRLHGRPIFDALAPEITWHDLAQSLAPSGVVRTAWALALSAAAVPSDALPPSVYKALVEGSATGSLPDGSIPGTENLQAFFEKNGPRWHISHGRKLDIPVLFGQGMTDSLFNAAAGAGQLAPRDHQAARKKSIFVGYNGGHVLPAVLPQGVNVTSDPCSKQLAGGDFQALSLRFFDEQLKRKSTGLTGYRQIHLATPGSKCLTVKSDLPEQVVPHRTGRDADHRRRPLVTKIASGPIAVAGSPTVTANVTSAGVDTRIFYGLAVGTTPRTPSWSRTTCCRCGRSTRSPGRPRRSRCPSVAVDVPAGQSLFLLATPVSDTFVGMGSRPPGVITLEDTVVKLPVVAP